MLPSIVTAIRSYLPDADTSVVERAYSFSMEAHRTQLRASGETYFSHCYAVAMLLTELKLDCPTIAAGLLHDVLEDTSVTTEVMTSLFGPEITALVQGVTKISSYRFPNEETAQAENWRKMLLAITKDIRVILIKLADRLHNMRTIRFLKPERQRAIATETLNLYAAFARRLGVYTWKSELEDLSFAVAEPIAFAELKHDWERRKESDLKSLELWKEFITSRLSSYSIPFRLLARPKNLFGIYQKMQRQHKDISGIKDLIGLRLITDTTENCYALLGLVHSNFKPVPGTFDDYISLPKMNMYQSLHTTIVGPHDICAEIQIRTEDMHRRAEYGIAAHWRYKEHAKHDGKSLAMEEKLDWLKQALEWQQELKDPREFLTALKVECTFDQIFIFTPKGKVIKLPQGATPLDFAYAVHTEIGHHCYGAKVNNRIVPLTCKLISGEMCEILTRKNARPHEHWLDFVITATARARIRKYLREHDN